MRCPAGKLCTFLVVHFIGEDGLHAERPVIVQVHPAASTRAILSRIGGYVRKGQVPELHLAGFGSHCLLQAVQRQERDGYVAVEQVPENGRAGQNSSIDLPA